MLRPGDGDPAPNITLAAPCDETGAGADGAGDKAASRLSMVSPGIGAGAAGEEGSKAGDGDTGGAGAGADGAGDKSASRSLMD